MAKRTKKVGIVGKYGTRYGSSLRKIIKKFEISQHATYVSPFCGKVSYHADDSFTDHVTLMMSYNLKITFYRPQSRELLPEYGTAKPPKRESQEELTVFQPVQQSPPKPPSFVFVVLEKRPLSKPSADSESISIL